MADRMTQVDELREAASRLRKLVADLPAGTTGPWRQVVTDTESASGVGICEAHTLGEHDACDNCWTVETWQEGLAAYLQSMHPGVALALADLLQGLTWMSTYTVHESDMAAAVRLAHAVLGREEGALT